MSLPERDAPDYPARRDAMLERLRPRPDAEDVFADVAEQLETLPVTTRNLLAAHQPDSQGKCQACTTGGRGTPSAPWPCGPYAVAKRAADAARADAEHDAEVAAFDAARRAAGA